MEKTQTLTSTVNSYLTFHLEQEEYAAHVGNVLNIIEVPAIVKVPQAPPYMKGIVNLRGQVLPVIDLKHRFGMPETVIGKNTCIVVMEVDTGSDSRGSTTIGVLVDQVDAVHEIEDSEIKSPPDIGELYKTEILNGIVERNQHFILMLDMKKIFSKGEWDAIHNKTN